ncbi:MAG: hypothetical protein M3T55_14990, partial [Pseudomonadota bacterium]|nr:hypothetical protein [Pseudomonadota bacterium]
LHPGGRGFEPLAAHHPASPQEVSQDKSLSSGAKQDALRSLGEGGLPVRYVYLLESLSGDRQRCRYKKRVTG